LDAITSNVEVWLLLVDEMSNLKGSNARIILEGANGVTIEQSLHFEIKAINNKVEYKVMLVEMSLDQEIDVKVLTPQSDS